MRREDQGWGYEFDTEEKENVYRRFFKWDSENRLTSVSEGADVTSFLYDADGERASKLGERGERLYFNAWWTANSDVPQAQPRNVANTTEEGSRYRYSKHIFVGSERIVTRLRASTGNWAAEDAATYWYHPDHLGSTSVVTDPDGEAYERIEYMPFGEMWLEHQHDANTRGEGYIPFRFTSKEWDEETGLYYYGARYLEPKLSRWMSADPAGFGLVNPMDGEGKPRSGYSVVEALNWYSYVSNNPVRYIDPTGMFSAKKLTLGVLQVAGGVAELAATYVIAAAAEAGSAGTLTAGVAILVVAGTGDGFRNIAEGAGKILAAFDDDFNDISIPQELAESLAHVAGASEETKQTIRDVVDGAETAGEFFMPGKPAIHGATVLLDKAGVADPVFESIDDFVNGGPNPGPVVAEDLE